MDFALPPGDMDKKDLNKVFSHNIEDLHNLKTDLQAFLADPSRQGFSGQSITLGCPNTIAKELLSNMGVIYSAEDLYRYSSVTNIDTARGIYGIFKSFQTRTMFPNQHLESASDSDNSSNEGSEEENSHSSVFVDDEYLDNLSIDSCTDIDDDENDDI